MHRRGGRSWILAAPALLLTSAALALLLVDAVVTPAHAAGAGQQTLTALVGNTPDGQAMGAGFVGVSMEYRAVHMYTGRDPRRINPVLVQLLRALAPGQAPVLRIGGDSTDSTWWPMRGVIPPGAVNYRLTKGWMRTTQALAAALGARLIMGINLASDRPALAGAEARAIVQGIGLPYIQALEIGNEADLYGQLPWYHDRRGRAVYARAGSYSLSRFVDDFTRWRAVLPAVPLAGPAFAGLSWMAGLGSLLPAEPQLGLVTFHRYPLRACTGDRTSPSYASIDNLLGDQSSLGLAQSIAAYVQVAHAHGLGFRLDELNSAACTGRAGVSDTFASALWMLDTLFNLAQVGVDGINVHTLPGAAYAPFSFSLHGSTWQAFVHPVYYGMLMFAQAFPPGAQLLPVDTPAGPVKVWAIRTADGSTRVVLINEDQSGPPADVRLTLPGAQTPATTESLLAPSISARRGVSLAGQTFGTSTGTGTLPGVPRQETITPALGVYSVQLPAASALLLTR